MAATDQFTIVVTGQGGHGSAPHLTSDPIVCAGFLISQVQTIVSRRIDPLASAVVSFGSIHGGEAFNIIPDRVQLSGTVRSFDGRVRKTIISSLKKICQAAAAFNCSARLNFQTYCPATVNQPALSKKVRALSEKILGKSALTAYHPVMGGEDFAFMAEKLSACYIFAGIGSSSGNNHSSTFNLNESVLAPTAYYLACLLYELARVRKK
ncbi:MAG TPA: M20/M25/M40 family metallo-hydrolase, partial [bacterium]|nr:M20/M25/M40 family metallo-hydrolase [bacterium]